MVSVVSCDSCLSSIVSFTQFYYLLNMLFLSFLTDETNRHVYILIANKKRWIRPGWLHESICCKYQSRKAMKNELLGYQASYLQNKCGRDAFYFSFFMPLPCCEYSFSLCPSVHKSGPDCPSHFVGLTINVL